MHRRFCFPCLLALLAGALLLSSDAAADDDQIDAIPGATQEEPEVEVLLGSDEDDWNEPAWIPSLSIGVGMYSQAINTLVPDTPLFSSTIPPGLQPVPLRGGKDSNKVDGPALTLGFELMGPELEILPADPRLLVQAGMREGLFPTRTVGAAQTSFDANRGLVDQVTQLRADIRPTTEVHLRDYSYAGMGMSFQLPIEGFNIKLKPSLSWIRSAMTAKVTVDEPSGAGFRLIRTYKKDWINHGIAPRLVLDAEVLRDGPISVGFFAEIETAISFGRLNDQFCIATGADTVSSPPGDSRAYNNLCVARPPTGTYSQVEWTSVERDRLTVFGGVGVRVSWMGLD